MSELYKRYLISAATTFVSTFVTVFALAISADSFTFSEEALIATTLSALIAAMRGLAKFIVEISSGRI